MKPFKPTYLYIKQHSKTGKLYFGKTTQNVLYYKGSGLYWKNHINKYGREFVVNLWFCLYYDKDDCTKAALLLSQTMNIVKSKSFLNQTIETGLGGGGHYKRTNAIKAKSSKKMKGKIVVLELSSNLTKSISSDEYYSNSHLYSTSSKRWNITSETRSKWRNAVKSRPGNNLGKKFPNRKKLHS